MKRQDPKERKSAPRKRECKFRWSALFSSREMVLVKKDLGALWSRRGLSGLLLLLPLALMVGIPLLCLLALQLLPQEGALVPQELLRLLPGEGKGLTYQQGWMELLTTLICPAIFLCVPILCSAIGASCAFQLEREEGTLETLLLSAGGEKSVYRTKVTACTLLSVAVSVLSFLTFGITATVADVVLEAPFFFNVRWLVLLFLLMPALALFTTVFFSWIIPRVHSALEALQTVGYLLLPVAVFLLLQLTGVLRWNAGLMLLKLLERCGARQVFLAGFDGFRPQPEASYYSREAVLPVNAAELFERQRRMGEQLRRLPLEMVFLTPSAYEDREGKT